MLTELANEPARRLIENRFAERFGFSPQFFTLFVQGNNDLLYRFGAAKRNRRLTQRLLQDNNIVIGADLLLQLLQIRNHLYEAFWPDRLQHLKFVEEVLHADAPFVKRYIVALFERTSHPFAALTVNLPYSRPNSLPFASRDPYPVKAPTSLFQIKLDLIHRPANLNLRLAIAVETSEHSSYGIAFAAA